MGPLPCWPPLSAGGNYGRIIGVSRPPRFHLRAMSDTRHPRTQKVIRRLFVAQLGLLAAVGALVLAGVVFTQHLGSFPFAFLTGALGGSISLLRRLRGEGQAVIDEFADSWV